MSRRSGNRIERRFATLADQGDAAFVVFLFAGDPDLERTVDLVLACDRAGVDVVELGIPFSDPMADGTANQAACERGLGSGTTVEGVLGAVARIREHSEVPILCYTYANPVLAYGVERFADRAREVGVDGVLFLDLPPDDDRAIRRTMKRRGLATVCLVAPNTAPERRRYLAGQSTGFVYYVCRLGVTGERARLPEDLADQVRELRRLSQAPVCIGFGISTPEQAAEAARYGDGVVVGSHLVRLIEAHGGDFTLAERFERRAAEIARAVHGG